MVTPRKQRAAAEAEDGLLSGKETRFVTELLQGADVATAGKSTGLSESTARRWMRRPVIRRAVEHGRRQVLDQATTRLAGLTTKAHAVLDAALDLSTPGAQWPTRTGAAKLVFELVGQGLVSADLSARLARFERLAAGKSAGEERGDPGEGQGSESDDMDDDDAPETLQ